MNRFSTYSRTLLLALISTLTSSAANLTYDVVLGNPNSFFDISGSEGITFFTPVGTTPTLSGTLSAGDQFRLRISAPTGNLFRILPTPAGGAFQGFALSWWSDGSFNLQSGSSTQTWTALEFGSASRSANPNFVNEALEYNPSNQFNINIPFLFDDDLTFKSLTVDFIMPAGYSRTFNQHTPGLVILQASYDSPSYLGPIASLVADPDAPVPEPATLALTAIALGALTLLRRTR